MTPFQQCAMSIVAHAFCRDLVKPTDEIRGKYVKVLTEKGELLFAFTVRQLSRGVIDLVQADGRQYKFFSEKNHETDTRIKSEDIPDRRLVIEQREREFIKGLDGYGNRFTITVNSWYKVKIEDDEHPNETFIYRLE